MRTALVMMTILGCDDSATDCHYVATINQRWPTIELCNAVSEKELSAFTNISFPTVVAVCQDPTSATVKADTLAAGDALPLPKATTPDPAEERAEEQSLARQALTRLKTVLPSRKNMRNIVERPVHLVEDGYTWVIRKLR
ncbi:hypothetical protein [Rhizobium sp. SL86]|uniref:hypothetical protein n=1 Tax=Rhizobium sp. SL86 TaxID=2995148 RepID=UPI002274DD6C|nr:hypothetical protein [Rhizobium sp. SL86]MCY1668717.1 hypothetical protein [Rhizobium sp. SL86]